MGKQDEECEGIKQYRETAKEIKAIHKLISDMHTGFEVNKANLGHLSTSFKNLSKSNSLTHFKLFTRTENLKIDLGKMETSHGEHVKHGKQDNTNKQHRGVVLISCVAVGVSLITLLILAKQAGMF